MNAITKPYGRRTTPRGRTARHLATVGAALILAGTAAAPANALAQAAGTAGRQQADAGIQAARSTRVTVVNKTTVEWTRVDAVLSHGTWTSQPPQTLAANASGTWQSESNGFLTGTEGWVVYGTEVGQVEIYWNNPFSGSNNYKCRTPPSSGYSCRVTGGSGNNASATFEVGWL